MAESQFSSFFVRRPRPKRIFCHFLHFGRGRNTVSAVFHSSAMAESQFSTFFVRRPRRKLRIYLFLIFRRGRNAVFLIFCFSAMAEMKFLLFFTRPPRRKANFQHFLAFSRGWRTIFHENWWFTPVFEQSFLKTCNLLSYLSKFFWKSSIYYRI